MAKKMDVMTVTEKDINGEKKNYWTRIGVAFENKDGGYTCYLDALPINGKIIIKEDTREKNERAAPAPF